MEAATVAASVAAEMSEAVEAVEMLAPAVEMLAPAALEASEGILSVHYALLALALATLVFLALRCCRQPSLATGHEKRRQSVTKSSSELLTSREFVRDMARLSEHIVMNDVPDDFWAFDAAKPDAAEELRLRLNSRERAPFFAPDKIGELQEKPEAEKHRCQVRWQRAFWCVAFKRRYGPSVADWIDTGKDQEKPSLVLLLRPRDGPPIIAVTFRGSKTLQDYVVTDIDPSFLPVPVGGLIGTLGLEEELGSPSAAEDEAGGDGEVDGADDEPLRRSADPNAEPDLRSARFWPFLSKSKLPCATLGCWKAYAGQGRDEAGHGSLDGDSPRARVLRAVERLLKRHPTARVVLTGHSLGGALATLCTFDLLAQSAAVRRAAPVTLISFACPRMFNQAFQDAMGKLSAARTIHAVRVVIGADMIPRLPPKALGCQHGTRPRLLLHPDDERAPCSYCEDDPDDKALWRIMPRDDHVCHALYLGGDTTPAHQKTVPKAFDWPIHKGVGPPIKLESVGRFTRQDLREPSERSEVASPPPSPSGGADSPVVAKSPRVSPGPSPLSRRRSAEQAATSVPWEEGGSEVQS